MGYEYPPIEMDNLWWIDIDVDSKESLNRLKKKYSAKDSAVGFTETEHYMGICISEKPERWVPNILNFFQECGEEITFVPVIGERYEASHTLIRPFANFDYRLYASLGRLVDQLEVRLLPHSNGLPCSPMPEFKFDLKSTISALEVEADRQVIPEAERNLILIGHWMENSPFTADPWDFDIQWEAGLYSGSRDGVSIWIQKGSAYTEALALMASLKSVKFAPEAVHDVLKKLDNDEQSNRSVQCYLAEMLRNRFDIAEQIVGDNVGSLLRRSLTGLRSLGSFSDSGYAATLTAITVDFHALLQAPDILALSGAGYIFSENEELKQSAMGMLSSLYNNTYSRMIKDKVTRTALKEFCIAVSDFLLDAGYIDPPLRSTLAESHALAY